MESWQPAAFVAACAIAVHYAFLRAASGRVNDSLGALILEGTAAFGIALNFFFGARGVAVPTQRSGIAFAALSGVAISVASVFLFSALRRGGPVAATGTIVLGGGVTLSALLAPILFGESFTTRRALGVALGIAAMIVLATEKGTAT